MSSSPAITLKLQSSAETLTLVRGMLAGLAELLRLDPELLDDIKTAVSEACNNVVMHAYEGAPGPLCVCVFVGREALEVTIRDEGRGIPPSTPSDERLQGVGIPIMRALAQRTAFRPMAGGGTEVWMQFAGVREGRRLYRTPGETAPEDDWLERLPGEAVVSLSPVSFLGGVLGRLARALAARARFSLDRFSDVYLVTDALSAHAAHAASGARINFALATDTRRLEVTVGPFRRGASTTLVRGQAGDVGSPLALLSDELDVRRDDGSELVRLVLRDERLRAVPAGA
jgi:serine/threonine-protein kinase RsbW